MTQPSIENRPSPAGYDATLRLSEFRQLRARGALCTVVTGEFAMEAAAALLEQFTGRREYARDAVTLLAEIATLEEPCLAEPGQRATFPLLVERLSDSFDPRHCLLYDRVFAQMITICRSLPAAKTLDAALRRFHLNTEGDLLGRKARVRTISPMTSEREREKVRKVGILSRVTLGADVAITSVVVEKAKRAFPGSEIVLFGSPKLLELFGGDRSIRVHKVSYPAEGGLLDRLQGWHAVLEAMQQETRTLSPEEFVLIDPDSRLLQLGLLPALRDESRYFFLESRCFGEPGQGTMSQITLRWLNTLFGGDDQILPSVSLREADREFGRRICGMLRGQGSTLLAAVSFGVGGDEQKRLPDPFEEELLMQLLADGATVLLDKGVGGGEAARAARLVERVRTTGRSINEINLENAGEFLSSQRPGCSVLTWQGGIGAFSAWIGESDEYIGYDSAGQHLAAALSVPTIDVFAESASPVFRERWKPASRTMVKVAGAPPLGEAARDWTDVLSEVMACHRGIRSGLAH